MSIKRISEFQAKASSAEELHKLLNSIVPYISTSAGCLACELLRNTEDETKMLVLEEWDSIESHQKSVSNFPADEMQAAMTLLAAPPEGA